MKDRESVLACLAHRRERQMILASHTSNNDRGPNTKADWRKNE